MTGKQKSPKRVTLADVARAAGVGVATVDRVLNGRATVSARRMDRVYEAARTLGYHGLPLLRSRLPLKRQIGRAHV